MACPKCGCKVHYQYDSGWDDEQCDERLERCAACGEVFEIEDAADDDEDDPETQPGAPGFDGANAWNAFNGEGCNRKASTRESGPFCLRPTQLTRKDLTHGRPQHARLATCSGCAGSVTRTMPTRRTSPTPGCGSGPRRRAAAPAPPCSSSGRRGCGRRCNGCGGCRPSGLWHMWSRNAGFFAGNWPQGCAAGDWHKIGGDWRGGSDWRAQEATHWRPDDCALFGCKTWNEWPKCAVPACQNKSCRALRSRYCWPHTPGDELTAQQNLLETEIRGREDVRAL